MGASLSLCPGAVRAAEILKIGVWGGHGALEGVGVKRHDFERPEMNLSDLSLRIANTIALLRLPEPYARRRPGGTRNMTVACDGGAGAQAGVLHKDGRTPRPTERRETRTVAAVLRATARAARCLSFSTRQSYCELQRARG